MSSTAGLDLLRGRPLPAIGTTEAKLQQRKLDALGRGVHRIAGAATLPFGVHLVGIGGAGARVLEQFLRDAPAGLLDVPGSRLTVLALDIEGGEGDDLAGVRALATRLDGERARIEAVELPLPTRDELQATVSRYPDYLKLEYPLYHPNPDSTAWLPPGAAARDAAGSVPRAIAKAVYGRAYYEGERPMQQVLKRFARSVEASGGASLVCIVFGLGGGTGSGIAPDLARHLSSVLFGRRVLVTGIGVAPHAQDVPAARGARLFCTLAELDVLCDESKNRGVTLSCGDLFKNPFTAGFIVVPQAGDCGLDAVRKAVNRQIATLFAQRRGANLWEALRLLNWVAAPSTQHSAARTPWGARWIHLFGYGDGAAAPTAGDIRPALGLLPRYAPEFIELRTGDDADAAATSAWAGALDAALRPEVPTHPVAGGPAGAVQFVLPRMARTDLALFPAARMAYDALPASQRHAAHALLLEQGLLLCEPSRRLEGMAGASLGGGGQWLAVPLDALRGDAA